MSLLALILSSTQNLKWKDCNLRSSLNSISKSFLFTLHANKTGT